MRAQFSFSSRGRKRFAAVMAVAALGFVGFALAAGKPDGRALAPQPIAIRATPISSFDRVSLGATRHGELEWLGGLTLAAEPESFGGWSGLVVDRTGTAFVAVSDAGSWLTGEFVSERGRLTGLSSGRIGSLRGLDGKPLAKRREIDAEGIALASGKIGSGQVYISFERKHRIGLYDIDARGVQAARRLVSLPKDASRMTRNEGIEAVAVLQGGRDAGTLVAFSENLPDKKGRHTGWIWAGGKPKSFQLTNPGEFGVTDAASLDTGGLLVLERRFRWLEGVRMRLRYLAPDEIRSGGTAQGLVLLEADQRQEIDNMEAVAVHRGTDGNYAITLMSDDNFNRALQRTIVLRFSWSGPPGVRAGAGP